MVQHESIFYRIVTIFTRFFLVNLLWILLCLPIVTIFPATSALFGTVRKWTKEGFEFGYFSVFFRQFKEHFWKSFVIGLLWILGAFILSFDLSLFMDLDFAGRNLVLILVLFMGAVFLFTSIYIFFVIVNYELSVIHIIKNSLLLSISHLQYTVFFVGMILIGLVVIYYFPFFLLVFGSVLSFSMYQLFQKISLRIEKEIK